MKTTTVWRALGPIDMKSVGRDPLLRWLLLAPLLLALVVRWLFPPLLTRIGDFLGVALLPYYPPLMGVALILLLPLLTAMVVGFLLLDQRDDGTLTALQVTPLSLPQYLAYRLALPMLVSVLVTLLAVPLSGLAAPRPFHLLLVAVGAAPLAPLLAVAVALIAQNKVQGFAVMKAASVVLLPPLVAYFVAEPGQWLFGIVPTYWPAKLWWVAAAATVTDGANAFWLYWLVGVAYQLLWLWWLVGQFNRRLRR